MAADMTARIKVEGLSEFKSAMTQASAAVRQSAAEEKKAEAQYKATGDAATYQQQKTEALTKKLGAQEKAVESARKACAALEKAGVAPDDKRLVEWKTKLANAETAVIKTRDELTKLNSTSTTEITKGLGSVEGKAKDAGTELAGIAGKLDRETIVRGLDTVTNKMESVIRRAAQMGKAIWDASTDATTWADSTRDAATAAGMTTTEYQQMAYAAQFFGMNITDLTNKQGTLVKAMDEGGQIMVGDWAIDTIDRMTGQKRSFNNIMTDIIDGLGQIEDPVARDKAAMELFGKSYKDLNGLVEAGSEAWQEKIEEAPVVNEESINSLADAADALKEMDAKLEALKMETLAALAPSITTIAEAVGTLAENLTKFLQTEEGQKLLKELGTAIQTVVSAITEQDFSGLVAGASGALEGLTSAFQWLADKKQLVTDAVAGIAGAFLLLKGASAGIKIAETVSSLKRLLMGAGNGAGAGAGAGAAGGGGSAGAAGAGAAAGKPAFATTFATAASNAWWSVGVPATVLAAGLLPAWVATKADRDRRQMELDHTVEQAKADAAQVGEEADAALEVVETVAEAMGNTGELDASGIEKQGDVANEAAALEKLTGMDTSMLTGKQQLLLEHSEGLTEARRHDLLDSILQTAADSITGGKTSTGSGDVMGDVSDTLDAITELKEALDESPGEVAASGGVFGMIDSIVENEGVMSKLSDETKQLLADWYSGGNESPTAFTDAQALLDQIESELNAAWDEYVSSGEQVGNGVAAGIRASAPAAIAEAEALASSISAAVRRTLEIASPSKVMTRLGAFTGEGLAEGINRSIARVQSASVRMARAAEVPVESAAGATYNGGPVNNRYLSIGTYNQNSESDLNALARRVIGVQRSERQAYGRRK